MFKTFILATILMTGLVLADEPPSVPEGGLVHYKQEPCTDPVFGLSGTCFYSHDLENNFYIAFFMNDLAMVIYKQVNGEYVEIWRRGADV